MRARHLLVLVLLGCATPGAPDLSTGERRAATTAHVVVHYPTGWGHFIAVRGSGAGLGWDQGQAAAWTDGDAWRLDVSLSAAVELKPLFDDRTWALGPNWSLAPGQTLEIWPCFFHDGGRLERTSGWYSHVLDDQRDIVVYLP